MGIRGVPRAKRDPWRIQLHTAWIIRCFHTLGSTCSATANHAPRLTDFSFAPRRRPSVSSRKTWGEDKVVLTSTFYLLFTLLKPVCFFVIDRSLAGFSAEKSDQLHVFAVVSLRQIRFSANGGELNILFRSQTSLCARANRIC